MAAHPEILVRRIFFDDDTGFNEVFNIRTKVFVEEQGVADEDEFDGFDHLANHYLVSYQGQTVGAGRWRVQAVSGKVRIERISVLQNYRRKGIGSALIASMLADIPDSKFIYLHSLLETAPFFAYNGFKIEGETFEEASLQHVYMVKI